MDARRRKLLVNLLHDGAFLGAAGVLPSHGNVKRDTSHRGMSPEEGELQEGKKRAGERDGASTSGYDAPPIQVDSIDAMRRLETARLADGQRIEVAGYYSAPQGQGGGSFQWAAHSRQPEDGGLSIVATGAPADAEGRFVRRVGTTLSPAMFGAMGDGSDQYAPLMRLAKAASTLGLAVIFPAGDYALSGTGVTFSGVAVSGAGATHTTLRYTGHERGSLVVVRDGASIEGMTLDGNVSDDPERWSASNYDAFTGCLPLYLRGRNVSARNLVCRHAHQACLRVEASSFKLENVRTYHSRGNHGDGIFVVDSRDGSIEGCEARDFTRIGFVSDTFGSSPEHILSERIDFIDCFAENGHHASVDYGDDEFNAGYWAENSDAVRFINCRSRDTTHYGFVATTGRVPSLGVGHFTLRGCIAETTGNGYLLSDMNDTPVRHTVDDCLAHNVARGFWIEMDLTASRLTGRRITTVLRGTQRSASTLLIHGDGHIDIRHLNETWQAFNAQRHDSIRASYASVVAPKGFKGELHLAHFQSRNRDTDEPAAVGFKLIGQSHLRDFTLSATRARLFHVPAERISLHDCEIPSGWGKAFNSLDVDACRLGDGVPRFDIFDTTQHHRYRHCQFDFTPGGGHLYLHNSDKRNSRHVVRFERCRFKKDLAQHGYMITLDAAPGVFLADESNYLTFRDCTFENTGQATDTPAIRTLQRPPQASLTGYGNRKNAAIGALTAFELDDGLMAEG